MLVAQVGTRSRSSLLRVGCLVRGWLTSIICLLIGKKKKRKSQQMVLENIRLAEQAQQNSGVCTSGGCGLELEQGLGSGRRR